MPTMMPVSCCGKKPFGMIANRYAVAATVPIIAASVMRRWRSATAKARS